MKGSSRRMLISLAVGGAITAAPCAALAWAAGTHAYVAKHTHKMDGLVTEAELCRRVLGANGPDLFNAIFEATPQALADVLHTRNADASLANLAPYQLAADPLERAYGFGFASHNNAWGTDSTAHYAGITSGHDDGYVIAKAAVVGDQLVPYLEPYFGFLPDEMVRALAREVSGNFVELAVDFLLADVDPSLGAALQASAQCYAGDADDAFLAYTIGPFLAPVLSPDPQIGQAMAEAAIHDVEWRFVSGLWVNGYALARRDAVGREIIVDATIQQGKDMLAYRGLPVPPDDVLRALIETGITLAQRECTPDFIGEIQGTIGRVNGQMSARGIAP